MGELTCYIHKDRTAIAKCSTCRKYICLECKRPRQNTTYGDNSDYYICPLCLANEIEANEENSQVLVAVLFGCFFFIIAIILIPIGTSKMENKAGLDFEFFNLVVVIVILSILTALGIGIYTGFKKDKKKEPNVYAESIRKKAKKAMEESKKNVVALQKDSQKSIFCKFCGAPLKIDSNECGYCGMTWIIKP